MERSGNLFLHEDDKYVKGQVLIFYSDIWSIAGRKQTSQLFFFDYPSKASIPSYDTCVLCSEVKNWPINQQLNMHIAKLSSSWHFGASSIEN